MSSQRKEKTQPLFQSNNDVAVHVPDLKQAEAFYAGVLQFRLVARTATHLHFDTGTFNLWVNQDGVPQPFIPSFSVPDFEAAARHLKTAGCKTVTKGSATYFEDPFGFLFDIIEDPEHK